MEILYTEIVDWTLGHYLLVMFAFASLAAIAFALLDFKNIYIRLIVPIVVLVAGLLIVVNGNHVQEIMIVQVKDWNVVYDVVENQGFTITEENGKVLELRRYID